VTNWSSPHKANSRPEKIWNREEFFFCNKKVLFGLLWVGTRSVYDEQVMSELIDPSTTASTTEHDFSELIESIKTPAVKPKSSRQGLPSQYRMRHDAHYVEELGSRSSSAEASEQPAPAAEAISMPAALRDLCQEFEGLASCFNLIEQGARPLRERVGLSLARIGVQRSIRYAQHLRVLLEDVHPSHREIRMDEEIRHAFADLKDEMRLSEATPVVDLPAAPLQVRADLALVRLALRACVGTAIALVEMAGAPGEVQASAFLANDSVQCEFRQDAYEMDGDQIGELFRIGPGRNPTRTAAVALHAARRIAQLHGGQLLAKRTSLGGSVFLLSFPKAGANSPLASN
jgi:hypothetical protein